MAAVGQEAVGFAFQERRICKQGRGQGLKRKRRTELMRHVGFARIIKIDLNRARAQHHIKAHAANTWHMAQHDVVTALGHDGQFGACLVRPKPKAQKAGVGLVANGFDLLQMPPDLGAGLVQILKRRTRQFKLARRLKAYGTVAAAHRDNFAVFVHRLPTELGHRH